MIVFGINDNLDGERISSRMSAFNRIGIPTIGGISTVVLLVNESYGAAIGGLAAICLSWLLCNDMVDLVYLEANEIIAFVQGIAIRISLNKIRSIYDSTSSRMRTVSFEYYSEDEQLRTIRFLPTAAFTNDKLSHLLQKIRKSQETTTGSNNAYELDN